MVGDHSEVNWTPIATSVAGQEVTGVYLVNGDTLTVRMDGGGQKSLFAGPAPAAVARMVLAELFRAE